MQVSIYSVLVNTEKLLNTGMSCKSFQRPQLTTIRQPISEMSARAVNLLAAHIHKEEGAKTLKAILDFELIERDSIAPPK